VSPIVAIYLIWAMYPYLTESIRALLYLLSFANSSNDFVKEMVTRGLKVKCAYWAAMPP
jgi:hypothetical protein